jgi:hypothetical protein
MGLNKRLGGVPRLRQRRNQFDECQSARLALRSQKPRFILLVDDRVQASGPGDQPGRHPLYTCTDRADPQESDRTLSTKLCEAWQWRQANGALRDMVCRGLLLMLHRAGQIELPPVSYVRHNPLACRVRPERADSYQRPSKTGCAAYSRWSASWCGAPGKGLCETGW